MGERQLLHWAGRARRRGPTEASGGTEDRATAIDADDLAATADDRRQVPHDDAAAAADFQDAVPTPHRNEAEEAAAEAHLGRRGPAGLEARDHRPHVGLGVEDAPGIAPDHRGGAQPLKRLAHSALQK